MGQKITVTEEWDFLTWLRRVHDSTNLYVIFSGDNWPRIMETTEKTSMADGISGWILHLTLCWQSYKLLSLSACLGSHSISNRMFLELPELHNIPWRFILIIDAWISSWAAGLLSCRQVGQPGAGIFAIACVGYVAIHWGWWVLCDLTPEKTSIFFQR